MPQHGTCRHRGGALDDQRMDRADGQRSQGHLGCGRKARRIEPHPRIGRRAPREQDGDTLRPQASAREADDIRRRGVEPLGIVKGDEDGAGLGEGAERIEERGGDREILGTMAGGGSEQERGLERRPLRSRERGQDHIQRPGEQVTQRGVRETRLRFHG